MAAFSCSLCLPRIDYVIANDGSKNIPILTRINSFFYRLEYEFRCLHSSRGNSYSVALAATKFVFMRILYKKIYEWSWLWLNGMNKE